MRLFFSKITNGGTTAITCTPNASSAWQSIVGGVFNWTVTTPSVVGSGSTTSGGTDTLYNYVTTSGQSLNMTCGSWGSITGTFFTGTSVGAPAGFVGISSSSGTDDLACEYSVTNGAMTAMPTYMRFSTSTASASVTGSLAF